MEVIDILVGVGICLYLRKVYYEIQEGQAPPPKRKCLSSDEKEEIFQKHVKFRAYIPAKNEERILEGLEEEGHFD